jgi:subtilisin family serine protease
MSLGTADDSPVLREAVYEASRAGLIMVAASGNSGGVVDYPAAYPEVLAVTAIDRNLEVATFSGTGSEVDYTDPGVEVYSTTNRNGYAIYSGTSMATPHVAGVLALAISKGQSDLGTIDLGTSLQQQGHGLIDAGRTLGILK